MGIAAVGLLVIGVLTPPASSPSGLQVFTPSSLQAFTPSGLFALQAPSLEPQAPRLQASTPHASSLRRTAFFFGGAATALVAHESGHVAFGLVFGAHPRIHEIHYGSIPFFAIGHDPVSRRKEFVISSAGLWVQSGESEWLLTSRPDLRHESAPFLKGMFAFNEATSVVYAIAGFGRLGPPERDTRGIAVSLGRTGAPEPVVGALVLAPAVLDGYRYLHPEARWAVWASRGVKIASVLLTIAAGR